MQVQFVDSLLEGMPSRKKDKENDFWFQSEQWYALTTVNEILYIKAHFINFPMRRETAESCPRTQKKKEKFSSALYDTFYISEY